MREGRYSLSLWERGGVRGTKWDTLEQGPMMCQGFPRGSLRTGKARDIILIQQDCPRGLGIAYELLNNLMLRRSAATVSCPSMTRSMSTKKILTIVTPLRNAARQPWYHNTSAFRHGERIWPSQGKNNNRWLSPITTYYSLPWIRHSGVIRPFFRVFAETPRFSPALDS